MYPNFRVPGPEIAAHDAFLHNLRDPTRRFQESRRVGARDRTRWMLRADIGAGPRGRPSVALRVARDDLFPVAFFKLQYETS